MPNCAKCYLNVEEVIIVPNVPVCKVLQATTRQNKNESLLGIYSLLASIILRKMYVQENAALSKTCLQHTPKLSTRNLDVCFLYIDVRLWNTSWIYCKFTGEWKFFLFSLVQRYPSPGVFNVFLLMAH